MSKVSALIMFIINYKIQFSSHFDMEKLMDKAIDFSSISFGFILAVLALLIQSTSSGSIVR